MEGSTRRWIVIILAIMLSVSACKMEPRYDVSDIPELKLMLYEGDEIKRAKASAALGSIGPEALPVLREAAKDADPKIREWGIYAISKICYQAPEVKPLLIEALDDEAMPVRYEAVRALGSMGAEAHDAIPAMIQAANDEDWRMRYIVTRQFGWMGSTDECIDFLLEGMESERYAIRELAVRAFTNRDIDADRALPMLYKAAVYEEPGIQETAIRAIRRMGTTDEYIPAIIDVLDDETFLAVSEDISLPDKFFYDLMSTLKMGLVNEDAATRAKTAKIIGAMGLRGAEAVNTLIETLDDSNRDVVHSVVIALGSIGPPARDAIPILEKMLEHDKWGFAGEIHSAIENIGVEGKEEDQ